MPRRFTDKTLIVASHNQGKVKEISDLLAPFGLEVISAAALNLPEPEETGNSYQENAILKAQAAASAAKLPALADDSGLSVDCLDGAPGIYSARWAQTESGRDFAYAMQKLEDKLQAQAAQEKPRAQFICALCLAWPDGYVDVFEGEVTGHLEFPPRGDKGFGYDPIFVAQGMSETFAEIEPAHKHAISHRADAFAQLVDACFGG